MSMHGAGAHPAGPCRNCDAALAAGDAYCRACGQKANNGRLALHEIFHDLLHALLHVDRSVLSLVRLLLTQPGHVSLDYVTGKRKRYFGPFSFLIIVVGLAVAAIALAHIEIVPVGTNSPVADTVRHHANLVFLAQVPLLALWCRLLFLRQTFNIAENLVLACYTTSMRTLFYVIVIVPILYALHPSATASLYLYAGHSLLWLMYFGFACSQFYSGNRAISWLKGAAAAILTLASFQFIVLALANVPK
jgi:hypothetical protein